MHFSRTITIIYTIPMKNGVPFFKAYWQKAKNFKEALPIYIKRLKNMNRNDIKQFIKKSRKPITYAILAGIAILIITPILTYLYFVRDLSSKERIMNRKNEGVVLLDREGTPFFTLFEAHTKNTVPLSSIPIHTQQAFIAVEDKDFYKHPGFSINGILRAIKTNIQKEGFAAGGSTISQQLMKNTLLSQNKNLLRKYQELVLAIELERRYSKDDILEMYLNTTYFGEGAFGIEDASRRYFSKSTSNLTVAESALLAGIIRAPSALSPLSGDKERAFERQQLILDLMQEQGYITKEQAENAKETEIVFNPQKQDINDEAVHFALMVQDQLIKKYGEQRVAQSGFVVKTTLDRSLQRRAQQVVANQVQRLSGNDVSNGAAVAIDPTTGEVLALVGSHDWQDTENGKINMAIKPRQPGSSFKPIIYAKALEEHLITPATMLKDEKVSFGGYTPRNYDNKFRGEVTVRYALANSLNIPAVHVMNMVGVRDGINMAQELGITTLQDNADYGLPLVLGAAEVPLIEMTNAYAAFANRGILNEYTLFTEVRNKNGQIIFQHEQDPRIVLPESIAFLISSILSDDKVRQDTFGSSLTLSRQAAVKTGTTENYRDALTIGYTPQIVVGAWVGNSDNTPMDSVAGSLGAAPIWRQIMESYLVRKPILTFARPSNVIEELICSENGLKAEYATSSAYPEFFLRGTAPTKDCNLPTPTPTPDEEKKDEDKDKNEDNKDEKENPTPTPTNIPTPTKAPTPTVNELPDVTASPTGRLVPPFTRD